MPEARPFFGGLPTEIELRKLQDEYGVPEAKLYPYADLATVCALRWPQDRARLLTVLARWRKKIKRDYGLLSEGVSGRGVKILMEGERTPHGRRFAQIGTRKTRRGLLAIVLTDLAKIADPDQRRDAEHAQTVAARILPLLPKDMRALEPPPEPAALPRRA